MTKTYLHQELVDEAIASKILAKSIPWLRQARWRGIGPRYLKIGRNIRYRLADLTTYLDSCVVGTTDQSQNNNQSGHCGR
jgi:hypothetical protein